MGRARNPDRDKAMQMWRKSGGAMLLKDIASELGVSSSTVRKWKSQDGWEDNAKRSAPKKIKERSVSSGAVKKVMDADISDKRKEFAMLYLQSFNATKAYMEAYGADYKTANTNGPALLVNTGVRQLIDDLKAEHAAQLDITTMDVLREYAKQARADLGDYLEFGSTEEPVVSDDGFQMIDEKTGEPMTKRVDHIHLKDQSQVDTSLLKSVKFNQGGLVVELYDKQRALDKLLDYLPDTTSDLEEEDDGLLDALTEAADDAWSDEEGATDGEES